MKTNQIIGSVTEHWMDKKIRLGKPINCPGNLIKISAEDFIKMQEYKNHILGMNIPLVEASQQGEEKRKEYLY